MNQPSTISHFSIKFDYIFCHLAKLRPILRFFLLQDDFYLDLGFLAALLIAFRLLAFGALSIRSLEQR